MWNTDQHVLTFRGVFSIGFFDELTHFIFSGWQCIEYKTIGITERFNQVRIKVFEISVPYLKIAECAFLKQVLARNQGARLCQF